LSVGVEPCREQNGCAIGYTVDNLTDIRSAIIIEKSEEPFRDDTSPGELADGDEKSVNCVGAKEK
jgi:hypothetical protein